jgi:hypothetical protein
MIEEAYELGKEAFARGEAQRYPGDPPREGREAKLKYISWWLKGYRFAKTQAAGKPKEPEVDPHKTPKAARIDEAEAEELKRHADKACCKDWSDHRCAVEIRMLLRTNMDHEALCVMARDRIAQLSTELRELKMEMELMQKHTPETTYTTASAVRRAVWNVFPETVSFEIRGETHAWYPVIICENQEECDEVEDFGFKWELRP